MQEIVEIGRATQDELRDDLRELFQGAIRLTLEMVLEEELKAMVGARRFERVRSRKDHRNGTYLRRLLTSLGQIEVAMPRSRDNGSPADVIGRYQRRSPELDEMMVEAYVSGVSQRKMGDVTEALMGERVGRSTVSRVAKRLDEAVEGLRRAPIEGPHPYLYLDATFLDARWARKVENVSALVAYAVGPEGHRRLLAVTLGAEESQQSWSELLQLQDLPLVILLDSNQDFPLVTAVSRRLFGAGDLPDFLLVGVGYHHGRRTQDHTRLGRPALPRPLTPPEYPLYYRSRDYTPSADPDSELPSGGAHAFVRFLHAELIPWVEAEYGTSPYRVLVGHSLGGLLAVYAVTSTPGVFSGIVASSPAVWWGEEEVLERLKPGPWSKGLALYTSLGSEETELMRTSWSRLRELLPDLSSELRQRAELFSDEGHSSVKPIAYSRGLRWVFGTSARSQDPVNALGSNAVRLHQAP